MAGVKLPLLVGVGARGSKLGAHTLHISEETWLFRSPQDASTPKKVVLEELLAFGLSLLG